jgi:hypothetical protein
MQEYPSARLDLTKLLSAVEDAPPFSAADVLGERLASELDAREVSFLIADFSGHALIRRLIRRWASGVFGRPGRGAVQVG